MEKTFNLTGINFNTGMKNILNSAFHSLLYSFSPKKHITASNNDKILSLLFVISFFKNIDYSCN